MEGQIPPLSYAPVHIMLSMENNYWQIPEEE